MNTKKLFSIMSAVLLTAAAAFASDGSYIRISNYDDEDSIYVYNYYGDSDINPRYEIRGEVSSGCESVRVIWSSQGYDFISEYLLNKNASVPLTYGKSIDDYTLSKYVKGSSNFVYNIGIDLDNMHYGSNYYRFIAKFNDGTYKVHSIRLYVYEGGAGERAKPVIYLYPEKKTTVKVSVAPKHGLTETIPEMGKQWKVTAYPDGKIIDQKSKKEYPYLFWESHDNNIPINMDNGFVIDGSEESVSAFFDEKLAILGLNENEISDFKEFWISKLSGSPYLYVTFQSKEEIDEEAPLTISPAPDSVIRVYFDYRKLEEPVETTEQVLVPAERTGFAVVEWGGRLYK